MDFIFGLLRLRNGILSLWDQFLKMETFLPCHKVDDACLISNLFFEEVVRLHGLPSSIISDQDSKFHNHFWRTLWG